MSSFTAKICEDQRRLEKPRGEARTCQDMAGSLRPNRYAAPPISFLKMAVYHTTGSLIRELPCTLTLASALEGHKWETPRLYYSCQVVPSRAKSATSPRSSCGGLLNAVRPFCHSHHCCAVNHTSHYLIQRAAVAAATGHGRRPEFFTLYTGALLWSEHFYHLNELCKPRV